MGQQHKKHTKEMTNIRIVVVIVKNAPSFMEKGRLLFAKEL
jgi:hypothetical protein